MGVCGSQLASERKEFHSKQLQEKDTIISDLKEKTKTLEEEKQRILDKKETLERDEIGKDMLLEQKNEQLQQLRSENDTLKAEIKKSPTVSESVGNIAKQTGDYIGGWMGLTK
ncbi:uncharacterized protein LOC124270220 [Haliotis rubra]|uniref:uncharacterized protein LOC124270220 n=1 Tax=Haliotis rubra TaxID=36100 RepID=UPI001EE5F1A8|nr:uncharacterized protein LOC124270220 [Haliotis rubra]